jgi:phage-related protein
VANGKGDVEFTFGVESFQKGFASMERMFEGFENRLSDIEKKSTQATDGFSNGVQKSAKKAKENTGAISKGVFGALTKFALLATGIIGAFKVVAGAVKKFIPEIGSTFSIASDIFFKNFLFPIRKALLPLLNRFLQWVQRSRSMFVQWGQIVVTIFKAIGKVISVVWNLSKRLFSLFFDNIRKMIGGGANSLTQMVNIVMFKIANVFVFLAGLMKPAVDEILAGFQVILNALFKFGKQFSKGFMSAFEGFDFAKEVFEPIIGYLNQMISLIKALNPLWKLMGNIVGAVFGQIGKIVGGTIRTLLSLIGSLYSGIGRLLGLVEKSEAFKNLMGKISGLNQKFADKKVNDAIIKPDGTVIETNPNDYITASTTPPPALNPGLQPAGATVGGVSLSFGDMVFPGVTPENARSVGEGFGDGVGQKLRQILIDNLSARGDRF